MNIPDFNIPQIDIPSIDFSNFVQTIIGMITGIIDMFFSIIAGLVSALTAFYDMLVNINAYVLLLCESCKNNNVNSIPLIDIIGLYRYIVTDPVFLMTYILVLTGCFFTIYKLIILLIKVFTMMKNGVLVGKNTKISFLDYLKRKIFK